MIIVMFGDLCVASGASCNQANFPSVLNTERQFQPIVLEPSEGKFSSLKQRKQSFAEASQTSGLLESSLAEIRCKLSIVISPGAGQGSKLSVGSVLGKVDGLLSLVQAPTGEFFSFFLCSGLSPVAKAVAHPGLPENAVFISVSNDVSKP